MGGIRKSRRYLRRLRRRRRRKRRTRKRRNSRRRKSGRRSKGCNGGRGKTIRQNKCKGGGCGGRSVYNNQRRFGNMPMSGMGMGPSGSLPGTGMGGMRQRNRQHRYGGGMSPMMKAAWMAVMMNQFQGGANGNKQPQIEIKTSRTSDNKKNTSSRRRLVKDDFDQFIVQKCINNNNIWMCLEYNYYDHTIFADYIVVNDDDDAAMNIFGFEKYTESEQWTVSNSNDEQCNNNLIKFADFNAICIDKQQQALIKYSDDNMDDLNIDLLDKMHWNEIYEMNDNQKKLCKNILSNRLCALFTFDDTTNQIQNIDAISIQKIIGNHHSV